MSEQLKRHKEQFEKLKQRIRERNEQTQSQLQERQPEKQENRIHKNQIVHVSGNMVETYDIDVQCALETKPLDAPIEQAILEIPQPKKSKRECQIKQKIPEVQQLDDENLKRVANSKEFSQFIDRSSKFVEKVIEYGEGDMMELLMKQGCSKSKALSSLNVLSHPITMSDKNITKNRVITDFDWSPHINDLFLASYSQNQQSNIKDQVGVVLLWNPALKSRAQFSCLCQSIVTSAKFYPFMNSTVLGGCYNGQLLLWDIRAKSSPVQRSGITSQSHKYPICSLNVVGTQISNSIISNSNDGMMCMWDIKKFSKPTNVSMITAVEPKKPANKYVDGINKSVSSSLLKPYQINDINITCCQFPIGDPNNYYFGSLNGSLYKNQLHNKDPHKITAFEQHDGPISGLSINRPSEFQKLNGLVLTSSFDWTVKLWNPATSSKSLVTFENSQDYINDVHWHPNNPSLFATVNNDGYLDIFDLTRDLQSPIAHEKSSVNSINKCHWNNQGSAIVTGDSDGNISFHLISEKYRRMDEAKYSQLSKVLFQTN